MGGMKQRIAHFFAALSLSLLFGLGLAVPVYAQDAQQQINNGLCAGSNLEFTENPGECNTATSDATDKINNIIHSIVNILSVIVGVVAVIMIIIGGFRYVTSAGNPESTKGARNTIVYAIIGLVIVALAQIIVHFVLNSVSPANG